MLCVSGLYFVTGQNQQGELCMKTFFHKTGKKHIYYFFCESFYSLNVFMEKMHFVPL